MQKSLPSAQNVIYNEVSVIQLKDQDLSTQNEEELKIQDNEDEIGPIDEDEENNEAMISDLPAAVANIIDNYIRGLVLFPCLCTRSALLHQMLALCKARTLSFKKKSALVIKKAVNFSLKKTMLFLIEKKGCLH